jgi:hypothetical protein
MKQWSNYKSRRYGTAKTTTDQGVLQGECDPEEDPKPEEFE